MEQQLSPAAQATRNSINNLSPSEREQVLALANQINDAASATTPEQIAEASSKIVEGVKAALAHGFKEVTAPDGTKAIEVKITRPDGTEVTCLLSEGARGKWDHELEDYAKDKLKGATLLSRVDFKAVVERLYNAIKGLTVANGDLRTEDAALKQAYQIATQGVRRDRGFSQALFDPNSKGAVAGRRISDDDPRWFNVDVSSLCAVFDTSPEESNC